MPDTDVVVIGSGIGGLSCAAWLARQGMKVLVLEQNLKAGGLCSSFDRAGFRFDPAACLISGIETGILGQTLDAVGQRKSIGYFKIDPFITLSFPGRTLRLYSGIERFTEELAAAFPAERRNIIRCVARMESLYDQLSEVRFLGTNFFNLREFISLYTNVVFPRPRIVQATFMNAQSFLEGQLKDPELVGMLASLTHYFMGAPASQVALLPFVCFLMGCVKDGCYYVKGGAQKLADTFAGYIEERGGKVLYQAEVERILMENGNACGVRTADGREFRARHIVSNADATTTLRSMVGGNALGGAYRKWLDRYTVSPSFFMVYLGLDTPVAEAGFMPSMYLYSPGYAYPSEYYANMEKNAFAESGGFMLPLISSADASASPEGMGTFVIESLGIPYRVAGGWKECKKRMTDLLIQRVEKTLFPGLSSHIVLTDAGDPETAIKYTRNCRGSGAAWDDTISQSGIFRLEQVTPVRNLYLSGHWTKPGGSVTATLMSGLSVAKRILEKENMKSGLSRSDIVA